MPAIRFRTLAAAGGITLVCCSAIFLPHSFAFEGSRAWERCRQERRLAGRSNSDARATPCVTLERRFGTGLSLATGGVFMIVVAGRARRRSRDAK